MVSSYFPLFQAMPWLDDLVESCDGTLNTLPVQCLCEYLLNSSGSIMSINRKGHKAQCDFTVKAVAFHVLDQDFQLPNHVQV